MRSTPSSSHLLVIVLLAGAAGLAAGCGNVNAVLEQVSEARQIAADLAVQFTKASDAANRAVMADTDEASTAFAKESREAADTVQKDVSTLRPKLESLGFSEETGLLNQFAGRFAEYRTLDQRILDLAVENTNLKAQRLAFGPAQEAADAFRNALNAAAAAGKADDRNAWHVEALTATAVRTVREIQVLQAPHIANADEAVMTRMEKEMATSETAARKAVEALRPLLPPAAQGQLRTANAALDRFVDLNMQIIALSRRNTNVRSLALSLDEKRTITASCEESLRALQAALAKRGFTNIRER